MISQDNNNNNDYIQPLAANTRQQRQTRMLTQEYMMHMMELPGNKVTPFTPQQAASQNYPLQFLYNLANAVLDDKTGDLLGILAPHQTCKIQRNVEQIIRNSDTMPSNYNGDNIFLSTERKYHKTDSTTSHTVASAAIIGNKKRMHIKLASPWEGT
jgi:hypothetical protein